MTKHSGVYLTIAGIILATLLPSTKLVAQSGAISGGLADEKDARPASARNPSAPTMPNIPVEVVYTEDRTAASYHADNHEVQLEVTRTQRPGLGSITLTFREDGAIICALEALANFRDPRAPLIRLSASVKGSPFTADEVWHGVGAAAVATDPTDIRISSGGNTWTNQRDPVAKSLGGLQGAPSFGSAIPPEIARSIAPFFQNGDDSSYRRSSAGWIRGQRTGGVPGVGNDSGGRATTPGSTPPPPPSNSWTSGNNGPWVSGKGSFRIFLKDPAHWPGDIGCFAAEMAIGMILENPAADAFGEQFCRNLVGSTRSDSPR